MPMVRLGALIKGLRDDPHARNACTGEHGPESLKERNLMVEITYVDPSGLSSTLALPVGWSLMQGAIVNGIDGIIGECGGSCVCGTCHCYVEESRLAELTPPSADELEILASVAADRRANSRLACQIKASAALDGLVVTVAANQE
jgi:2Fe-2S ferredoxin